ncbi:MAG: hypothetical protein LUB56_03285 [Coprobacillus sp.]|nr:hypothetical protein [Coprobacillus sp.]
MKKNVLMLMGVSLSVFCLSLTACNKNKDKTNLDDDIETQPFTASISGLYAFYAPSDKIDWDEVGVSLTLSNYATVNLVRGEIDPTRRSYTPGEGEYSLVTNGLYNETGSLAEGTYPISYAFTYMGELYEGSFDTVVVSSNPSSQYGVFSFTNPAFQTTYESNLTRSDENGVASEDNFFKSVSEEYEVGADNPFIYQPSFSLFSLSGASAMAPSSYQVDYSVSMGGKEVGSDYVTYDGYFGFQFTEKAIGNVFTISMTPRFFTSDINGNPIGASSMTVKVCDGYNVYNPLDLGRINLTSVTTSELSSYTNGYSEPIFYSSDSRSLVSMAYSEIWANYLGELGETNLKEVNGIYIHRDLDITSECIPSEYLVSEEEMEAIGNGNNDCVGSLRDYSRIYTHLVDTNFTFNGNLFKIDTSSISWGKTFYEKGMNDTDYYYSENKTQFNPGHSNLFLFSGKDTSLSASSYTVTFKNVESNGNTAGILTAGDDEESIRNAELASGSLIFFDSSNAKTVATNTIIKNYMIGYFSCDAKCDASTYCLSLQDSKIYDCYNSALFIRESESNYVKSCDFARFGGPAIFVISNDLSTRDTDNNLISRSYSKAGVTVNENVTISAQLQGDEAWFTLVGATSMMTTISNMDAFFRGGIYPFSGNVNVNNLDLGETVDALVQQFYPDGFIPIENLDVPCKPAGKTILDEDGKFNFIEIGLDYDYLSATNEDIYTDYIVEHTDGSKTHISADMSYDSDSYELTVDNQASFPEEDKLSYVISEYFKDGDHPSMAVFMTNTGKIIGLQVEISFPSDTSNIIEMLNGMELEISLIDLWQWAYTGGENGGENISIDLDETDTELFFYYRPPALKVPFSGILELYDYVEED